MNASRRPTRFDELPSANPANNVNIEEPRSQKAQRGIYIAWGALAVEVCFAFYVFLKGEGRVAGVVGSSCVEGIGPQLVSGAEFFRVGTVVISQLILWACGFQIQLPDKAFTIFAFHAYFTKGDAIKEQRLVSTVTEQFGYVGGHGYLFFYFCVIPFAVPFYIMYPIAINAAAVCAINAYVVILAGCVVFLVFISIVRCWDEINYAKGAAYLTLADDFFVGTFSTWANMVQSGPAVGLVFAVLPTYEIVYNIVTECF
ncbi:unnamed protein product [Scytosiphon promiscuus]